MYRDKLIQQLKAYQAKWVDESMIVQQLIEFVETHSNCFKQTLKVGHITGSVWLVNRAGTHVLLTHHKKLNKWIQLGGHADGDPDILRVALREAAEESGLEQVAPISKEIFDVDIHEIPERGEEPAHYHYDIRFAMQAVGSDEYIVSDESHDLAWIEIDKLKDFSEEESVLRMAGKWERRTL